MGEFCGDCTGNIWHPDQKVERCPGVWFIDLPDGTELEACGLLESKIVRVDMPVDKKGRGQKTSDPYILEFPNPLIDH